MLSKKLNFVVLWFILFFFNVPAAQAVAPDNWQWTTYSNGITGLQISGLVVSPTDGNTAYALTNGSGVYKTTNGGTNWTQSNTGLPSELQIAWASLASNFLTIDPNNASTLYAQINGQIYKSTNGASSWSLSDTGVLYSCGRHDTAGVIVDPSDSNHLFAASITSGCSGGVFESTDAGANWTQIAGAAFGGGSLGGEGYNDAWPLALDPADPDKMYFSTVHEENFRSSNGGASWTGMSFPSPYNAADGTFVKVHPSSHKVFFSLNTGMVTSSDYGVTLTEDATFSGKNVTGIEFALSDATIGYAVDTTGEIYKSTDSGATWSLISTNSVNYQSVAVSPTDPSALYLGTAAGGIYTSADGGATITAKNTGFVASVTITATATAPGNTNVYYILAGGTVYKSSDKGVNWTKKGALPDTYATSVVTFKVDPKDENILYSGTEKIWKSTDGGINWAVSAQGATFIPRDTFLVDSSNSQNLYFNSYGDGKLYKSTNGGSSWTSSSTGITGVGERLRMDPTNSDTLYVASSNGGGFWKSVNGGANWTKKTTGLGGDADIKGLAIDTVSPNILYAASYTKVYKSTDYGESWAAIMSAGVSTLGNVMVDVANHNTVHAVGYWNNLGVWSGIWYKSTDAGSTWVTQSSSGPSSAPYAVANDLSDSTRFFGGSLTAISGVRIYENYIPKFHTSTFTVSNHNGSSKFKSGDTLDFTMTVTNSGPITGTSPSVKIVLPSSGITYVPNSTTVDGVTRSPDPYNSAKTLNVSLIDLEYNDSVKIAFQATIDSSTRGYITVDPTIYSVEDTSGTKIADLDIYVYDPDTAISDSSCQDIPPSKAPELYTAVGESSSSIRLFFTEGDPNADRFTLRYGTKPDEYLYGSLNIGGKGSRSYLVQKLSPSTKYYFQVGNAKGCKTGFWSNVLSARTFGASGNTAVASEISPDLNSGQPQISSSASPSSSSPEQLGDEVANKKTEVKRGNSFIIQKKILFLLLLILLFLYLKRRKKG